MDFLQTALVLLIIMLAIFLSIGGWMVFLILKDLRRSLVRLNEILYQDDVTLEKIKKSVKKASSPTAKIIKTSLSARRFFRKS